MYHLSLPIGVRSIVLGNIARSRSQHVAKSLLEDAYDIVVVSDRAESCVWINLERYQVCRSHLLRDFQRIFECVGTSFMIAA